MAHATAGLSERVRRQPLAVALALLFAFLFALRLWVAAVGLAFEPLSNVLPGSLGSPFVIGVVLTWGVGFGLAVAAYVRVTEVSLPLGWPRRGGWLAVVAAVVVPTTAVVVVAAVANGVLGSNFGAVVRRGYGAAAPLGFVLRVTVPWALFGAIGYGLVFHGIVLGTLRELVPAGVAVVLTAAVAGVYRVIDAPTLPDPPALAVFLLASVVTVALGFTLGLGYRAWRDDSLAAVADWRFAPVVALGLLGVVAVGSELTGVHDLLRWGMWVLTVGVGAHATARSDSLWSGVAALLAYLLLVDLVTYAEVLVGLAPPA